MDSHSKTDQSRLCPSHGAFSPMTRLSPGNIDTYTRLVLTPLGAPNDHGLIPVALHFLLVVSAKGTPARLLFLFGFGRMPRRTKTSRMTLSLAPWFRFLLAVINAL